MKKQNIFYSFIFLNDFYFFIPEIYLIIYIIFLLCIGVIWTNNKNHKFNKFLNINLNFINNFYLGILILLLLLYNNSIYDYTLFNNFYISNKFNYNFKLIFLLFVILYFFLLEYFLKFFKIDYEFLIIILFSFLSILLIFSSNNLLILYLSFELFNLSLYILISFKQDSNFSTEAGLKYFIISSVSSGFLLFGISLLYGFSGFLNYNDIMLFINTLDNNYLNIYYYILLSMFFILISFFIKLSVAPLHFWALDVYYGCNIIIMFYMMIFTKIINLFIIIYLLLFIFSKFYIFWSYLIYFLNICCLLIGTIGAIYQTKLRKILIYSMISNTGFFLACFLMNNIEGLHILLFYLFNYLLINFGLFICILNLNDLSSNNYINDSIYNLSNLFNINPVLSFNFLILLFSLGGLPPLLGFYNKFYLFILLIKNEFYIFVFFNLLMSIISFFYYLRLLKIIFFDKNNFWFLYNNLNKKLSLTLIIISLFNILFFLYPTPLLLFFFKISVYFYI
jgi:NADH-quinone oxidoreductase subunit N